jgi:hypothetical protein
VIRNPQCDWGSGNVLIACHICLDLDMAGRHRARFRSIQIIAVNEVAAAKCKRPNIVQFHVCLAHRLGGCCSRQPAFFSLRCVSLVLTTLLYFLLEPSHQVPHSPQCATNWSLVVPSHLPCFSPKHCAVNFTRMALLIIKPLLIITSHQNNASCVPSTMTPVVCSQSLVIVHCSCVHCSISLLVLTHY